MIELVYDDAAGPIIQERFPHVKIEDASDYIHEGRIQIELPDSDQDAFYKHAIREGYYTVCFGFKLRMMSGEKADKEYLERLVAELKAERSAQEQS